MLRIVLIVIIALSLIQEANAKIIFSKDKIKVSGGIKKWSNEIKLKAQKDLLAYKNDKNGYTECRKTAEINKVIICGTYLQRDMNALLLRATIFSEGGIAGHKKGDIIPVTNKELQSHLDIIGGHDITSKDLLSFYNKINQKCAKSKKYCLTQSEQVFYNRVIKPLQKTEKNFVIITFSVQSPLTPNQIVSHEFLHSVYFLDPVYKNKINQFWKIHLSNAERKKIKKQLKVLGYDDHNEQVMQNEFQAYMLMDGADDARLAAIVPKFEPRMFKFLTSSFSKQKAKA